MFLFRFSALFVVGVVACFAQGQNPSPMVEHTREHPRLTQENPAGLRIALATGNLFIPEKLAGAKQLPLIVHFHGVRWVAEVAAASDGQHALISVEGGSG